MCIVNEATSYHIEATYNKVIIIYKNDIMEILKINVYLSRSTFSRAGILPICGRHFF